ncbi:hypothetical protein Q4V65_01945 [Kutzneria buriramensis]|nr:hypothetical protein [Kutzneria buriramensis]
MPVVVLLVFGEDLFGVGLVHDESVVEDLSADGADHSLAVGNHARSLRRTEQHLHLVCFEDSVEGGGVLAVSVAEEEAEGLDTAIQVVGEVMGLLGRPLRGRVRGDAGDVERADVMLEERQRVQPSAGDRVHMEEVRSDDPLGLGGEELTPTGAGAARSGVDTGCIQDLPDRRRCDPMPQPGQFALDSAVAPPWVFPCQAQRQLLEPGHSRWAAGALASGGVVHFLATSLRCQVGSVPGATGKTLRQRWRGSSDDSAASQSRSAGS